VHVFQGTYGDYLLSKVGKVFPGLKEKVLSPRAAHRAVRIGQPYSSQVILHSALAERSTPKNAMITFRFNLLSAWLPRSIF
jgi:hypothetical protein